MGAPPLDKARGALSNVEGRERRRKGVPGTKSPGLVKSVLSKVALISGLYDGVVGAFLLVAADSLATLFGVPPASPRIFSDLNGLFLVAVGVGYYLPWRDPVRYRGYMWVMGPLLKGAGAALFLIDYFLRGSPASFLLFAASDGALAMLTLWALLTEHP